MVEAAVSSGPGEMEVVDCVNVDVSADNRWRSSCAPEGRNKVSTLWIAFEKQVSTNFVA